MPYRHLQQKHMPRSNIASVGNRKRHRATAEAQSEYKLSDNANERQGLTPDDLVFQSLSDFVCASMGQSTPLSDLAKNKSRRCDSFYGLAAVVFPTQTFYAIQVLQTVHSCNLHIFCPGTRRPHAHTDTHTHTHTHSASTDKTYRQDKSRIFFPY
jgi:hypothetical protein